MQSVLPYPPPPKGSPLHLLQEEDSVVKDRIPIWARFPVAFCREAMNFYPHWYQEEFIADESIFQAAAWSRQIGKSMAVAAKAIHTAFTEINSDIIIIAPVIKQAKELYKKVKDLIDGSPLLRSQIDGRMTQEEIKFVNGSRIINLAVGDQGIQLRGYSIALLIIDEAAFVPADVFTAVEQGLSATGGKEIVISTPYGKHNAFYRIFYPEGHKGYDMSKGGKQQIADFSCYHYTYQVGLDVIRQSDGRPQLSQIHLDRQKRKLTEFEWRAEYEAEFIEGVDQYFAEHHIDALFNRDFVPKELPNRNAIHYMAIDISKGRDYTAVAIGERVDHNKKGEQLTHPHMQIVYYDFWKIKDIGAQYPKFRDIAQIWNPIKVFFDKTAIGERPFEEMRPLLGVDVEGYNLTDIIKIDMFGNLTMLMAMEGELPGWKRRIQTYPNDEAIKQFNAIIYEIPKTRTRTGGEREGNLYKIHAARGHDDIPNAFALLSKGIETIADTTKPSTAPKESTRKEAINRDERVATVLAKAVNNRSKRSRREKHPKVFW